MHDDPLCDLRILESWHKNAQAWTVAVRARQIESRRLVTDRAIVDAVMERAPRSLLDLGCGEGWLIRALADRVPQRVGVDAVPELIEAARSAGGGEFRVASYERVAGGDFRFTADAVVCNFSLLGKESVEATIGAVPRLLTSTGVFVVQTLHPVVASPDRPYEDGWRPGTWTGFGSEFSDPAPWYFRTLGSWVTLLRTAGLRLLELREPKHPSTGLPVSVIFIADVMR